MNIVLLSGGSGKRLWPLSNDIRSKQFIKLFKYNEIYESMVQRVYRQITTTNPSVNITIATNKSQVSSVLNQLEDKVSICLEPTRRDTFPAITLVCAYLHDEKNIGLEENVIISPIDTYVEDGYFSALNNLYQFACENDANLTLMGVEPTYPSEKYGYIIPKNSNEYSDVIEFKEKPSIDLAEHYIDKGALWNCGVFALRLGYILDISKKLTGFNTYQELLENYDNLEKISFDYAVVEKEDKIKVMRYAGEWKDIGTWNTLVEEMTENTKGDVTLVDSCKNTNIINELPMPVLALGLKNVIVACSSNGILISDNVESSYIKEYVEQIDDKVMFAEKSWGKYQVLNIENDSMTVKIILNKGKQMNYHSHQHREEIWTIISGEGRVVIDDIVKEVSSGEVIKIPPLTKHTIIADTILKLNEIQLGNDINVHDKQKHKINFEKQI